MGVGTAMTGFFPTILGLYITTVVMSVGFHYYETLQQSLALQWIDKKHAAHTFGRLIAVGSFAGLICYAMIYLAYDVLELDYRCVYLLGGSAPGSITRWSSCKGAGGRSSSFSPVS